MRRAPSAKSRWSEARAGTGYLATLINKHTWRSFIGVAVNQKGEEELYSTEIMQKFA